MIALRQVAGLTEEQMAAKLDTRQLPPRLKVTRMLEMVLRILLMERR